MVVQVQGCDISFLSHKHLGISHKNAVLLNQPFALKECREGKRILITASKLPAFSQSGLFNIMPSGQVRNNEKLPALSVVLHRRVTILSKAHTELAYCYPVLLF